ncbi:MAG TPA: Xaa-Pro aminopeptidase [Rectinemataceae bacterium]|nr:Xaa-Pro aminopeptidase [Rectinemataceae bacterium]
MFESSVYESRRIRLAASLRDRGASGLVLLAAHAESPINYPDNCYPFRQDSNWLYFIGLGEPNMIALIDIADGSATLFGDDLSMDDMIWTGSKPGIADLAERSKIDCVVPLSLARRYIDDAAPSCAHFPPFCREETLRRVARILELPVDIIRDSASPDLVAAIIAMREIKEEREVAELEKATTLSAEMHMTLLRDLRPGWTEMEAAALFQQIAARRGCSLSFGTIGTVNGQVLHNHDRDSLCADGDLFLLDGGAELPSGYAGDLTTSFPVGKKFSPRRAAIYRILLSMFAETTGILKPGLAFVDAHKAACLALARGLVELGIMRGDPAEAVEAGAHALFFPHGIGHMIGLDVHDMEGLGEDNVGYSDTERSPQFGLHSLRLAKPLVPGMVHSVEPGIYFIPGLMDKWRAEALNAAFIDYAELEKWRGCGGMRVEEDWLVAPQGCRRLGPVLDKSLEAIEEARSGA